MAKISEGPITDDGHGLILEGRYLIRTDQPLSQLSRPDAQACMVKDKQDPDADLFALLTPPDTFVRHDMVAVLQEKPLKRMRDHRRPASCARAMASMSGPSCSITGPQFPSCRACRKCAKRT